MTGTFKCLKSGHGNTAVFTKVAMRLFYAQCSPNNRTCNKLSSAFLAASGVCYGKFFT